MGEGRRGGEEAMEGIGWHIRVKSCVSVALFDSATNLFGGKGWELHSLGRMGQVLGADGACSGRHVAVPTTPSNR